MANHPNWFNVWNLQLLEDKGGEALGPKAYLNKAFSYFKTPLN